MTAHRDTHLCWESLPSAEARAAAGAEHLDALEPGWSAHVDAETLDIASGGRCTLGQRYGSYERGLRALGLTPVDAVAYGFAPLPWLDGDAAMADCGDLTMAMVRLIEDRRGRTL